MKNNSRLTALLLALFLLLFSAACSAGGDEETTETAGTSAPETTVAITEETTEEVITVVTPPETTTPETLPPEPNDILRILMQDGEGEALLSGLGDEENRDLLAAREQKLLYEHGLAIELSKTANLSEKLQNDLLAGNCIYDLLLPNAALGMELLAAGLLENLSEAGIGITPDSIGIQKSITESLSVGGGVYLLCGTALVSDITATNALKYNGTALSSDPIASVKNLEFTTEVLLGYISELNTDEAFALGEASPLVLFSGAGGMLFSNNEKGLPTSSIIAGSGFAECYSAALKLKTADSGKDNAVFTVGKISSLSENEIYLPLPMANADSGYSSPVDHSALSILCAPAGVISGSRLRALIDNLNTISHDYKEAIRNKTIENGAAESRNMLDIIESEARLDLGILLGWGDLDDYISDGMEKGTSAEDLLADRITEMRNKAVEAAAKIVADRLGIN